MESVETNIKSNKSKNVKFSENEVNEKMQSSHLPKNVNEYRHIINKVGCQPGDVGWVLDLRAYTFRNKYDSLKDSTGIHPDVYTKSLEDYRSKVRKDIKQNNDNKFKIKGTIMSYEHLVRNKVGMPSNPTQFGFDSTLRTYNNYNTNNSENWKTLSLPKNKNLLNVFLPPMTVNSKENLDKINKFVARPLEQVNDVK